MSCAKPLDMVSSLVDGRLSPAERENALAHLETCRDCDSRFQYAQRLRLSLRTMDQVRAPETLVSRLRVLASHERERRLRRASWAARFRRPAERLWLFFDNLMRPLALPFAGGLVCALLMIGIWVPAMEVQAKSVDDVPLPVWVYDNPSPRSSSLAVTAGDVGLILTIDERGRVSDYVVTAGHMTPELGDMILRSRFNPAMCFGQPTRGRFVYRPFRQTPPISVTG